MLCRFFVRYKPNEDTTIESHVKVNCSDKENGKAILENVLKDYTIEHIELKEILEK